MTVQATLNPSLSQNKDAQSVETSTNNGQNAKMLPAQNLRDILNPVTEGLVLVEDKLRSIDSSLFAPLANAFVTLIGSGGKRLRPALALLSADCTHRLEKATTNERVIALASAVEMLHTATLVHDDVIDGALLRRGAPTLNATWSGGATVLAGNYMFGTAAYFSSETQNMRVIRIFSDTIKVIVDGEMHQLHARHRYDQPKDDYYQRIYAKTASLFCAATEGAGILTGLGDDEIMRLRDYGYNLGMAFQIVDDMLDFTGTAESLGKPSGSDLRQGTLTLPFFYYLQQHPFPQTVIENLESALSQSDDENPETWYEAVHTLVEDLRYSSAIKAARQEATHFLDLARQALAPFPMSTSKHSLLALCDFVVERTY
ncbi:MAG: polyprenyl synthetase family protein [Caldilineaceae bacterium]